MADQEAHPSPAEQRMRAVAKLKRAASLPRMKDGRRPPMHVEAMSEGEKAQSEEEKAVSDAEKLDTPEEVTVVQRIPGREQDLEQINIQVEGQEKISEPDSDHPLPTIEKASDVDLEADTELEEPALSPAAVFKKRRTRSRSRSRGSKDFKAKLKASQSPVAQLGGDSSPDENPPVPSPVMLPMIPPLISPIPHFPFLQQSSRFLRSPTAASPEMSLFYPGTSPPTPLPSLEELQKGLMRSNSAGSSAAGRRMAMHKLTGGTETYEASPPSTPPPSLPKLTRNNTVAGGERIAARQFMLSRLGTRITKEADAEGASGAEDRGGATSPHTTKRRRRRSRRTSVGAAVSDSDFNSTSTNPNTPAFPPTPLPTLAHHFAELRAQSTTPNQLSSSRTQSSERIADTTPPPLPNPVVQQSEDEEVEPERPEQTRRRSVLIEDPDDEDREPPDQRYAVSPLPGTPQRTFQTVEAIRSQHVSETLSNSASDSVPGPGVGAPAFMSQRAPSRNEVFQNSPFMTPLKEKLLTDEDEEEQVLYPASTIRPRTPYANVIDSYEREISWVASPVPEIRMPIDDDEEDEPGQEVNVQEAEPEDEEAALSTVSSNGFFPETEPFDRDEQDDISPRASSSSKSVLVESETSPEVTYAPASDPSAGHALPRPSDESGSPQFYPTRLSVASQRSPLYTEFSESEDRHVASDASAKRTEPSTTWEKVKNTFSRAGSSTGRRSRTNSIATRERRDHTDSSISRESGASLLSARTDKGENGAPVGQPQAPPLMQSPSASASILSLVPHAPPRGSVSPIPPPSSADMSKYQNAKLFPFPGMLKLEEERRKIQPMSNSSTPDVSMQSSAITETQGSYSSYSNTLAQTPDTERRLGQQNVDSFRSGMDFATYHQEYMDLSPSPQQNGTHSKLPTTLPGVKQWLSKNLNKKPIPTASPTPGSAPLSPSSATESPTLTLMNTPTVTNKKPSLSDIFGKKANEMNEWDGFGRKLANSNSETSATLVDRPYTNGMPVNGSNGAEAEMNRIPKGHNLLPLDVAAGRGSPYRFPHDPSSFTRLATPDPSSLSDYPAPSASEHSSTPSSQYSLKVSPGAAVLERLEESLTKGSRSPTWVSENDGPPRKLLLSSLVLQVVNPNTVKDRFLFLFNDILVIAKPVTFDQDNLMDNPKASLADRKYIVKTVVQLRQLRFCADRSEVSGKVSSLTIQNPLIRSFVSKFAKDPEYAISSLSLQLSDTNDGALLGQLLSRILELDRSRLGEYLARKGSKTVLKSYLDSFGLAGLRVDVALRVFLHSVNLSRHMHYEIALQYLIESFASRWYEANIKFVAYDKDMAVHLVWALVQLNRHLHGGIADEPGPTNHVRRNVTSKEFLEAFRKIDARYRVSDELLLKLYKSIYHERLCQACTRTPGSPQEIPITIKRVLPTRLTYKAQSEPIVFRLPHADPLLSIELYGQDMEFDPPVLHFAKSSEASFRVVGKSLGTKTITMCRAGPNAIKYSGLPFSHTVVVERAFMRNTFQLAFAESDRKRRYMFSMNDPIVRNLWVTSLQRHIESSIASAQSQVGSAITGAMKFQRATDAIAFKVLRDTLIGTNQVANSHRTNGSASTQSSKFSLSGPSTPYTNPLHTRSKSRSRVYHQHGAGKDELELQLSSSFDSNDYSPESSDQANTPEQRQDGILWTARDLEVHCQQSSLISLVLSYLQVGTAEVTTPETKVL